MIRNEQLILEAHPGGATLYVAGAISVPALLRAMERCEALPPDVWVLRVELSAAEPLDQGTQRVLWHSLRRWREKRGGVTRVSAPPGTHDSVTEALRAPCRTMTRRAHLARMLTQQRR
jgi:ABC-type transporter Mla MlaB component